MNRKYFVGIAEGTILGATASSYLLSDKRDLLRADPKPDDDNLGHLSWAKNKSCFWPRSPSVYNAQPWFVQYLEPYRWIVGNDRRKWLPAVDPEQRETLLSSTIR